MIHPTDPQHTPSQQEADILAQQCHTVIETLRRKRLSRKLLTAALDGLRLVNRYKDPATDTSRKILLPSRQSTASISIADLLRD